jgi:hypothetical protein
MSGEVVKSLGSVGLDPFLRLYRCRIRCCCVRTRGNRWIGA